MEALFASVLIRGRLFPLHDQAHAWEESWQSKKEHFGSVLVWSCMYHLI